ncbi:MAG: VOC family protein [Oligoflexia bacterium]|nr:VOC family protein [Oligoflexia bacterium]
MEKTAKRIRNPSRLRTNFILYVQDQEKSAKFYTTVLAQEPRLHVPGMTEFELGDGCVLGLMPEKGIKRLLGSALPDPGAAHGVPRAEVYLSVDDPEAFYRRALQLGAKDLSPILARDWGDSAGYVLDPDGHVLAFATAR